MRASRIAGALGLLTLTAGCADPCLTVCEEMATFASEDCGVSIPRAEIDSCIEAQSSMERTREDRQTCREFGDVAIIREAWDCTEVARYFPEAGDDEAQDP